MASSTHTAPTAPAKRDRTHYLYIAVIVAVALGIAVGLIAPDFVYGEKAVLAQERSEARRIDAVDAAPVGMGRRNVGEPGRDDLGAAAQLRL